MSINPNHWHWHQDQLFLPRLQLKILLEKKYKTTKEEFKTKLTFASFITTPIDALRTLSTLLIIPSESRKGRTVSIALLASASSVKETSQSLIVNEVMARHNLSPEFRTVSLMSSMARNATDHNFSRCFSTYMKETYIMYAML